MKFIVPSQLLLKNLQIVSGIITTNSAVPITEGILFEIQDNILRLTATDLETTITTELEVSDAEEDVRIVIPSKIVLETLKTLPEVPVIVKIEDKQIEMFADTAHYSLVGYPPEEFPEKPSIDNTISFNIEAKLLSNIISKTIFATSQSDIRPVMAGVLCDVKPDQITFVATDGHRLVRFIDNTTQTGQETSFILPKRPLSVLKNYFSSGEGNITIACDGSRMASFSFEKLQVITKLVEGRYPNYAAVIPQNNKNILKIDRLPLLQRIRSISPYADQATHQIRLQITSNELKMTTEDLESSYKATASIACNFEMFGQNNENTAQDGLEDSLENNEFGNDNAQKSVFEIGFGSKFLQEMLSNLDSGEVIMELGQPGVGGLIYSAENGERNLNLLMLLMPVML